MLINIRPYLFLAGGMAIYGSAIPVSKLIADVFPTMLAAGLRVTAVAIVLSPVLVRHRDELAQATRGDWLGVLALALIGVVLFSVLMLLGMERVPGVVGAIIVSSVPAITALGSFIVLRERFGWRKATGVAFALAGLLLVNLQSTQSAGQGGNIPLGSLLILGAVCSEATHTLLGKVAMRKFTPILLASLSSMFATLLIGPIAVAQAMRFDFADISIISWLTVLWWGVGIMGLGFWL